MSLQTSMKCETEMKIAKIFTYCALNNKDFNYTYVHINDRRYISGARGYYNHNVQLYFNIHL